MREGKRMGARLVGDSREVMGRDAGLVDRIGALRQGTRPFLLRCACAESKSALGPCVRWSREIKSTDRFVGPGCDCDRLATVGVCCWMFVGRGNGGDDGGVTRSGQSRGVGGWSSGKGMIPVRGASAQAMLLWPLGATRKGASLAPSGVAAAAAAAHLVASTIEKANAANQDKCPSGRGAR